MADKYLPGYSFSGFQANNPSKPPPGPRLDDEFAKVSGAIAALVAELDSVRRDDGKLENNSVTLDALTADLRAKLLASGIPAHRWVGTALQFQNSDGSWGPLVELGGPGPVYQPLSLSADIVAKAKLTGSVALNSPILLTRAVTGRAAVSGLVAISQPLNLVPWTPSMLGFRMMFSRDAGALPAKKQDGTTAGANETVDVWQDNTGNVSRTTGAALHAVAAGTGGGAAAAANRPIVAPLGAEAPNGQLPIRRNNISNRLNTPLGAFSALNAVTIFRLMRINSLPASGSHVFAGHSQNNFQAYETVDNLGSFKAGGGTAEIELNTNVNRWVLHITRRPSNSSNFNGSVGGTEVTSATGSGFSATNVAVSLMNQYGANAAADVDLLFEGWYEAPDNSRPLSRANEQRLEGWMFAEFGVPALPSTHPYYATRPYVPAGTTSTADWVDVNEAVLKQVFEGFDIELQAGAFSHNGVTQPANEVGGAPYDLIPSERLRLAREVLGYGFGFRYIRWAGGIHNTRAVSADGRRWLPHYTNGALQGTQLAATEDQWTITKQLLADTGKPMEIIYEEWGALPRYKANNSVLGGNLNYPDPSVDPSGYAGWIDQISTDYVGSAQLADQFGFKIGKIAGFNEAGNPAIASYTSVSWRQTAAEKKASADIMNAIIGKARAATWTNTSVANIKFTYNSWDGPQYGAAELKALPNYQYLTAWTYHGITDNAIDAENMPTFSASLRDGRAVSVNEFWYNEQILGNFQVNYGADAKNYQFANTVLLFCRALVRNEAVAHEPMIHLAKPTYAYNSTIAYALTIWKSPSDPNANNTDDPTYNNLQPGYFDFVRTNWNAVQGMLKYIPWNAQVIKVENESTLGIGRGCVTLRDSSNKLIVLAVNRTNAAMNIRVGLGGYSRSMIGHRFSDAAADVLLAAQTGTSMGLALPAYTAEFWTQSGNTSLPVGIPVGLALSRTISPRAVTAGVFTIPTAHNMTGALAPKANLSGTVSGFATASDAPITVIQPSAGLF